MVIFIRYVLEEENDVAKEPTKKGLVIPMQQVLITSRTLVLVLVEEVCENYNNLDVILNLLGIKELPCVHAFDLKLANSFLGLGECSSTYPCPWCD